MDDILLNYVIGVLENVNDDDNDESFDIEEFIEVMAAYIPRFETIERLFKFLFTNTAV